MKPLSPRQADRCESANEPKCVCRCGGALHGANRGQGRAFLGALSETDPHYTPTEERKAEIKAEERRQHAEAMARRYAVRLSFERSPFDS
jgi:hypothetical protein